MMKSLLLSAALLLGAAHAQADAVDQLRSFVREVQSGRAMFEQTVTSPDGSRRKASSGSFEFQRPDRFRFAYTKPYPQLIVADGRKVWVFDPDLNQVTARKVDAAMGATPAALLAGRSLDRDFTLTAMPDRDGLAWARATPKVEDGAFVWMMVGFRGPTLAAVEILDRFGQRSVLKLSALDTAVVLPESRFRFVPPAGADVIEQ